MVVVPKAGEADPLPVAIQSEPLCRRPIGDEEAIAAQECDGIAFDQPPAGAGAAIISHVQPQERHLTDILANEGLDIRLGFVNCVPVNI